MLVLIVGKTRESELVNERHKLRFLQHKLRFLQHRRPLELHVMVQPIRNEQCFLQVVHKTQLHKEQPVRPLLGVTLPRVRYCR